jgi:hypothetical protein
LWQLIRRIRVENNSHLLRRGTDKTKSTNAPLAANATGNPRTNSVCAAAVEEQTLVPLRKTAAVLINETGQTTPCSTKPWHLNQERG